MDLVLSGLMATYGHQASDTNPEILMQLMQSVSITQFCL